MQIRSSGARIDRAIGHGRLIKDEAFVFRFVFHDKKDRDETLGRKLGIEVGLLILEILKRLKSDGQARVAGGDCIRRSRMHRVVGILICCVDSQRQRQKRNNTESFDGHTCEF